MMLNAMSLRSLLPFLICGFAIAQPAGTFTAAAKMTTARSQHTATLLANGTVLIAGGYNRSGSVSNAEVYDPVADTFTPLDGLLSDSPNTATLLADGRVLLVGTQSQLYDPSTYTFTPTGNGPAAHGCAATLLGNGRVLFTDDPLPYGRYATAELYDPDTGAFVTTGRYASVDIARFDREIAPSWGGWDCRRATLLGDGRVLVAGGVAAEIYDPRNDSFSLTGTLTQYPGGMMSTLPVWGDPSKATLLLNGEVLFSGGDGDLGPSTEAWLYDPASGAFARAASMTAARYSDTMTLLPDGSVMAAGGRGVYPGAYGALDSAEIYSAANFAFSTAGEMTTPRYGHAATLLANGRVLITGGISGSDAAPDGLTYLSSAEIYTPAVLIPTPSLFSLSGDGTGQGAIWHSATGQISSATNPAIAGEALSLYTTRLADGSVIRPQVGVGGRLAEVLFSGAAPGYPGYYQVNFLVPNGVVPGPAIPVRLTYLGRVSNVVSIGAQ